MNVHILKLIDDLDNEISELKSIFDALNDNDVVGINTTQALIQEKKNTIKRLKKLL
jgi:cell division protein ZapA (FtsZ GTPase activity inhibitor)